MPRTGGIYSLPAGYLGTTGQKILTSQHNPPMEDIAQALTGSLPRDGTAPMLANLPMGGFRVTGLADGTAATDAVTKAQVDGAVPTGCVMDWAGASAPIGWLLCYGQAVSRADYAALFAVCGTTYGEGNGSTTFNLPDLRGRVVAGKDNMGGTSANRLTNQTGGVNGDTLGASGGEETHTLTIAQMPSHNHGGATGPHAHNYTTHSTTNTAGAGSGVGVLSGTAAGTTSSVTASISPQGGGAAHNNVQPVLILQKIIKTGL